MAATGTISPSQAGYDLVQTPKYSAEGMANRNTLKGLVEPGATSGIGFLNKIAGGDKATFDQLEAPAFRQFNQQQAQTASRFSGAGIGARRSSGFQNVMGDAAAGLAEKLQGNRMNLQMGAWKQLMDMYGGLMSDDPYELALTEKKKKDDFWRKIIGGGLPIAGGVVGGIFGGPTGASFGSQIGAAAGEAFM